MSIIFADRFTATATRWERLKDRAGVTWRTVSDGSFTGEVEIELDQVLLRRLAERAVRNKSHRAVIGSGLLIARARNVKHNPEE